MFWASRRWGALATWSQLENPFQGGCASSRLDHGFPRLLVWRSPATTNDSLPEWKAPDSAEHHHILICWAREGSTWDRHVLKLIRLACCVGLQRESVNFLDIQKSWTPQFLDFGSKLTHFERDLPITLLLQDQWASLSIPKDLDCLAWRPWHIFLY